MVFAMALTRAIGSCKRNVLSPVEAPGFSPAKWVPPPMALATVGAEPDPRAKARFSSRLCGTAEAVPFHRVLRTFLLQLSISPLTRTRDSPPFPSHLRVTDPGDKSITNETLISC